MPPGCRRSPTHHACRAAGSTRSEAAVVGTKLLGCGCAASRSRSRGLERRALRMILHGCTGRVCHAQVPSCSQPSQACARVCGGPVAAPDTLDLGPPGGSLLRCSERHWLPREASASFTTQDNDCPRALRSTLERMAALEKFGLNHPTFLPLPSTAGSCVSRASFGSASRAPWGRGIRLVSLRERCIAIQQVVSGRTVYPCCLEFPKRRVVPAPHLRPH